MLGNEELPLSLGHFFRSCFMRHARLVIKQHPIELLHNSGPIHA